MKKITIIAIAACLSVPSVFGQTKSDTLNIQKAVIAIDGMHKCNEGIVYLNMVSEASKNNPTYILTMAKAYDCLSKNSEAIKYYEQYVAIDRTNAAANKRLIALKDEENNSAVVKQQERRIKNFYKGVKHGNKSYTLNDNEYCWGIGSALMLGGQKSPYLGGLDLNLISSVPFANNHWLFKINAAIGFLNGGKKTWFASVLNTTEDDITDIPAAFHGRMNLAFAAVVTNKRRYAITVGPDFGFESLVLPEISMKTDFKNYSKKSIYTPFIGLTTCYLFGEHFYSSLSYSFSTVSTFKNENIPLAATETPLNASSIRLVIGFRGVTEMSYFHR